MQMLRGGDKNSTTSWAICAELAATFPYKSSIIYIIMHN